MFKQEGEILLYSHMFSNLRGLSKKKFYLRIRFILFRILRITKLTIWIRDPRINSRMISTNPDIYSLSETLVHLPTSSCFYRIDKEVFLLAESNVWSPFVAQDSYGLVPRKCNIRIKEPVVSVPTQHNYFHWLFEDLPSILRVLQFNKDVFAVRAPDLPRFQIEVINIFFDNPIILDKDWFIAEKLIVSPKIPIDFTNKNSRSVVDILQSTFLDLVNPRIPRANRIYISRKVDNLPKELEILLQEYLITEGFRIIALEHLTFQDQVKLFNSAEFVVALHGAGLSNLIWSTDKVKVFEIFMPNRFNECYRNLSNLLGHNYASVSLIESQNFTDIVKLLETFIASK